MIKTRLINDDTSRCANDDCPLRENCARHKQISLDRKSKESRYIRVTVFKPKDGECDWMIEIKK